jgi:murein DD-endopeptidase MepM/ murein hydrolase activator NlpD
MAAASAVIALVAAPPGIALGEPGDPLPEESPATTAPVVSTTTTSTTVPSSTSTTTSTPAGPSSTSTSTTSTTVPDDDEATTTTTPGEPDSLTYDPAELLELMRGYDEAVALEAELLAQFELSMGQVNELNAALVELSDLITAAEADLLDAEQTRFDAEQRVRMADIRLEEVEERLAAARRLLEQQAVEAYVAGGRNATLFATLNSQSAQEMGAVLTYAEAVSDSTGDAIVEFAAAQVEAEALRVEADEAAQEAEIAVEAVEARRDDLREQREIQARAQADAFIAALAQQDLIDEIEAQRGSYEQRLATLSGTSDSINSVLRSSQQGHRLPRVTEGILLPPVENPNYSSPFGPRLHPIFGTVRMHNGVDISSPMGRPVRASAAGEVVVAGWQGGYGFTVVVDHGNGLATLNAHLSAVIVEVGEEVAMGDIVGLVGSTGWSTGPHIHFEVRVFGNPSEPLSFLGGEELLWDERNRPDGAPAAKPGGRPK